MKIEDFVNARPVLLPEQFLQGHLQGWGIMENLLGDLQKRFTIEASGEFQAGSNVLSFTETWTFDDGFTDTLSWRIQKRSEGRYSGRETRVKDDAAGEQAGFAFNWRYTRDTPQKSGTSVTLNFNDWFYLIDPNVCIVRGSAGRLGIPFSVVHVTYRKSD
jgi:Protein of unknown function (DUF3833)